MFNFTSDIYFTIYVCAHLFCMAVMFVMIILATRANTSEARLVFLFFSAAAFVLMAGYYFELRTTIMAVFKVALKIEYFSIALLLIGALRLVSVFCDHPNPKWLIPAQCVISAVTIVLALTLDYNNILFSRLSSLWNGHFRQLIVTGGIYYPIHYADCMLVYLYCLYVCATSFLREKGRNRKRIVWLLAAMLLLAAMVIIRSVTMKYGFEVISFFVLAASLCLFISLLKYQLLNPRQVAFESVFNHSQDGIIIANADGEISFYNQQAEKMLSSAVTGNVNDHALLQMVLDERKSQVTIGENVYDICVEDIVEKGRLQGYEFVITDLTELFSYMDRLREKTEEADTANAAKSNFLANMSHEIRTPLNAILGMDEMILRESKNGPVQKYALDIQSAGKTLLSIVNDILDISKIESGKAMLVLVEYNISSVLNDIVNMTMNKARNKGLTYDISVSPDIPSRLYGDEIRIRQVMLNVINNAIKYTPEGSVKISVGFIAKDEETIEVSVRVEDTGIGIREEDLKTLFRTFQRLDETSNRRIEGTGLGLIITKQYAEMMNGRVEVESEFGVGSAFTIYFEQRVLDPTPLGDFSKTLDLAQREYHAYVPKLCAPEARILIVDDNEMNLQVITGLLSGTGMMLNVASSGEQCIEMVRKKRYDLILMDQMMPGLDGTQTLHIMREQGLISDIPVIVLTADAVVGAKEAYIASGFTDYLSKPIMYPQLEETLIAYLPEKYQQEQSDTAQKQDAEQPAAEKKSILVIDSSPESLKARKAELEDRYNGTYVRSMEKAQQYLEKHDVDYILFPSSAESRKLLGLSGSDAEPEA